MERARAASVWYAGQWAAATRRQWVLRSAGVEGHAVAASVSHTLVACKDHVLAAGQNAAGELGGMPDATRWHTRRIEGAVQHVAAGSNFSWIGNSERMLACGTHNRGQLGALRADGALAHADVPRVSEIAAGLDHVVVRSGSELGRSDAGRYDSHMRRVALPDAERAASVRAGGDTSLALTENGRMFVWGNTEYGQALCDSGDQLRTPTAAPCDIPLADARLGGSFVVLRDDDGKVYTAGYGATATGAGIQRIKQVDLPHAHCIGAGLEMAAAATADGIYVWGLLRTPDGLRHIARPERIPTDGPGPQKVSALVCTRDALLALEA